MAAVRNVFVGRNSTVWRRLSVLLADAGGSSCAISHCEVAAFGFTPRDRVWVLAYSRRAAENTALLSALGRSPAGELVYVSSSSTIALRVTACYAYPRIKHLAERDALALARSRVLTLGMMYEDPAELPGGANIATSYRDLARFVSDPHWPDDGGRGKRLFGIVRRPFARPYQQLAHAGYGVLLGIAGRWPCLLRPLDLFLRALGLRAYGYVHLSNSLWISTMS